MTMDFTNPIDAVGAWDTLVLGGLPFSGVHEWSGDAIKRRTDRGRASGRSGGRTVSRGYELAELEITLKCTEPVHFEELSAIIALLFPRDAREASTRDGAVTCTHPSLAQAGITYVRGESASLLRQTEPGCWAQTIKLIEHRPAPSPARNVTRVTRTVPDLGSRATAFTGLEQAPATTTPTPPSRTPVVDPD